MQLREVSRLVGRLSLVVMPVAVMEAVLVMKIMG